MNRPLPLPKKICIRCGSTFRDTGDLCDLCIIYDVASKPRLPIKN